MKPETTVEETVTADEMVKQVALDKVGLMILLAGDIIGLLMTYSLWIKLTYGTSLDFICVSILTS